MFIQKHCVLVLIFRRIVQNWAKKRLPKNQEYSKKSYVVLLLLKILPALNQGKLTKSESKSELCNFLFQSRDLGII